MFVAAMYSLFWTRRGDAFMEFFMYNFFSSFVVLLWCEMFGHVRYKAQSHLVIEER